MSIIKVHPAFDFNGNQLRVDDTVRIRRGVYAGWWGKITWANGQRCKVRVTGTEVPTVVEIGSQGVQRVS